MNYNDDKVKEILENVEIPDEVSPENMKIMLDKKAAERKRSSRISMAGRITATAAACAVIVGATLGTTGIINHNKKTDSEKGIITKETPDRTVTTEVVTSGDGKVKAPYMSGADSYEQIYKLIEKSNNHRNKYDLDTLYEEEAVESAEAIDGNSDVRKSFTQNESAVPAEDFKNGGMESSDDGNEPIVVPAPTETTAINTTEPPVEVTTEVITQAPTEPATTEISHIATEVITTEVTTETTTEVTTTTAEDDYSETYNQEEYVLEADIIKTDGERIYYIYTGNNDGTYSKPFMNITSVDNGNITDTYTLELFKDVERNENDNYSNIFVYDMYIYNDMLAVIGSSDFYYSYYGSESVYNTSTFVSFYTKENEPQLIGTYTQDGYYNDVRIAPDGYMYLTTNYSSQPFYEIENCDDINSFIPRCGANEPKCIEPCDILLPENELDNYGYMSYTVIGSIDLTQSGEFNPYDTKALAGYSGDLYMSADNLYATSGYEETSITRISVGGGLITPQASGTVEGFVKDQFSLSEYNGYLRVATTINKWIDNGNFIKDALNISYDEYQLIENNVFVLDMDMNVVGKVEGFARDETIKSVNFSGNMGYVVTYEQTDPLFAIDLSDPTNPFITDEFKILGYSTYMQNWDDGLLLGFGADADEYGFEKGVKIVMFDNSDPYNLREVGLYNINQGDNQYIYSQALYERKALLIAPEKNLIGVPVTSNTYVEDAINGYYNYSVENKYMFFSYENGEFILKGELSTESNDDKHFIALDRAIYIGNYIYAVSADCIISADIETLTETDRFYFN